MICNSKKFSVVKGKRGDNNDNSTSTGFRDDDSSSKKNENDFTGIETVDLWFPSQTHYTMQSN